WAAAETLTVKSAPTWRAAEAITYFARAIGAARNGHAEAASADVDSLAAIAATLARAGGPQAYWSGEVRIQHMAASAWLTYLRGDTTKALAESRAAGDLEDVTPKHPVTPGAVLPARELYGDLLLQARRPAEAREAYEASLALQPHRSRSLAGLALAGR